jgi:hypothetical protein
MSQTFEQRRIGWQRPMWCRTCMLDVTGREPLVRAAGFATRGFPRIEPKHIHTLVRVMNDVHALVRRNGFPQKIRLITKRVAVVAHEVAAADRPAVTEIATSHIRMSPRDHDVEEAAVCRSTRQNDLVGRERHAAFVSGGDLEAGDHRWREAAVEVHRGAGGYRVE